MNPLENYHHLVARIDALCHGIEAALGEQITCSEGCSACCTSITVFPVEGAALREAIESLSPEDADAIRRHVAEHLAGERCPLLANHRCLLYAVRPIICRTHGLPILYLEEGQRKIDYCPRNLSESESLSGSTIIDLDKLNSLLVAVNALYISRTGLQDVPERLTIADAVSGSIFLPTKL